LRRPECWQIRSFLSIILVTDQSLISLIVYLQLKKRTVASMQGVNPHRADALKTGFRRDDCDAAQPSNGMEHTPGSRALSGIGKADPVETTPPARPFRSIDNIAANDTNGHLL
jgi:hypothetical protein